jgi:hypothetical protein
MVALIDHQKKNCESMRIESKETHQKESLTEEHLLLPKFMTILTHRVLVNNRRIRNLQSVELGPRRRDQDDASPDSHFESMKRLCMEKPGVCHQTCYFLFIHD